MIEVRNLTKRFGAKTAVDDLTFQVKPGVVTGFLGPNGSGKSTTMRMIMGLDNPTRGEALINGKPFHAHPNPAKTIGALLDATWAHPGRSARSHLASLAAYGNLPASRVDEVLDMVGLRQVAGKKAGGFSLGMRQRLGLAGAMLGDPAVLMFDEPVNGLDPEGILWVRNFMKARAKEGRTVLVSSHLLSEMALTADELVVIGRGKLRAQATVAELIGSQETAVIVRTPYRREFAEALTSAGLAVESGADERELQVKTSDIELVGQTAADTGVVLHELRLQRPSLEEAFMRLTSDDVEYRTHETLDGIQAPGAPAPGFQAPGAQAPGVQAPGAPGAQAPGVPGPNPYSNPNPQHPNPQHPNFGQQGGPQ